MKSGQNSNNDFRIKFILGAIIIISELVIILLTHNSKWDSLLGIVFRSYY